jgi:hypothetical protein
LFRPDIFAGTAGVVSLERSFRLKAKGLCLTVEGNREPPARTGLPRAACPSAAAALPANAAQNGMNGVFRRHLERRSG